MSALLEGYGFKIVARIGNEADIPTLVPGEIGYDLDKKTFRVGDDTSTPPRIPTTKSLGNFDFTAAGTFTFSIVALPEGGTVDGVDVSKLNAKNGLSVRKAANTFDNVALVCGDQSLQITGGDGTNGNIDLRIHPDVMALINNGGYLTTVYTLTHMLGNGTQSNPLGVKASSTAQVGITRFSTNSEASAGSLDSVAVTPANLLNLPSDGAVMNYWRSILSTTLNISVDATMTGAGTVGSPLSIVQATETQRGAAEIASQAETNAGVSNIVVLTPARLAGLGAGTPTALALKAALGISFPISISDLKMTGPGILGRTDGTANQPPQVIPYASSAKVIAGNANNDNDVVNQSTLKYFTPSGTLKPVANAVGSLPAPATVGAGSMAYDSVNSRPVFSNGSAWTTFKDSQQGLFTPISAVAISTSVVTVTQNDYYRYAIYLPSWNTTPQVNTGTVQFNGGGSWSNVSMNVTTNYSWYEASAGSPALIKPAPWLVFAPKGGSVVTLGSVAAFIPILGITQTINNWNGQVKLFSGSAYLVTYVPLS